MDKERKKINNNQVKVKYYSLYISMGPFGDEAVYICEEGGHQTKFLTLAEWFTSTTHYRCQKVSCKIYVGSLKKIQRHEMFLVSRHLCLVW